VPESQHDSAIAAAAGSGFPVNNVAVVANEFGPHTAEHVNN
jgi:hypothetical protein